MALELGLQGGEGAARLQRGGWLFPAGYKARQVWTCGVSGPGQGASWGENLDGQWEPGPRWLLWMGTARGEGVLRRGVRKGGFILWEIGCPWRLRAGQEQWLTTHVIVQRHCSGGSVVMLGGQECGFSTRGPSAVSASVPTGPPGPLRGQGYPLDGLLTVSCPWEHLPVTAQRRSGLEDLLKLSDSLWNPFLCLASLEMTLWLTVRQDNL